LASPLVSKLRKSIVTTANQAERLYKLLKLIFKDSQLVVQEKDGLFCDVDDTLKLGDEMMLQVDQALSQIERSVINECNALIARLKATESKKGADIIIGDFKTLMEALEIDFKNLNEQCGKMFSSQATGVSDVVLDYHSKASSF
jgi:hypothetical protein